MARTSWAKDCTPRQASPVCAVLTYLSVTVAVVLSLVSLGAGYFLGARSAIPVTESIDPCPPKIVKEAEVTKKDPEVTESSDEEDDFGELADGDLSAISPGFNEPCKLVRSACIARRDNR